jgi:hypothetical protein
MRPSMNARQSMETDQPQVAAKKVSTLPYIVASVCLALAGLAIILAFRIYTKEMGHRIDSLSEVKL